MRTPDVSTPARRRGLVVVAALAVAAVAVGFASVSLPGDEPASRPPAGAPADTGDVLHLDQGPSDDEAAVAACAGDGHEEIGGVRPPGRYDGGGKSRRRSE